MDNLPLIAADVAGFVLIAAVLVGLGGGFCSAGALPPVVVFVVFQLAAKVVGMDCYVPHIRHGDLAVCHADFQIHGITGKVDAVGPVLLVETHGIVAVLQLTAAAQKGHRHRAGAAVYQVGRLAVIDGHAVLFQHIGQEMFFPPVPLYWKVRLWPLCPCTADMDRDRFSLSYMTKFHRF